MHAKKKKRKSKKKKTTKKKKTKAKEIKIIQSHTTLSGFSPLAFALAYILILLCVLYPLIQYFSGGDNPPGPPPTVDDQTDPTLTEPLNPKKSKMDKVRKKYRYIIRLNYLVFFIIICC